MVENVYNQPGIEEAARVIIKTFEEAFIRVCQKEENNLVDLKKAERNAYDRPKDYCM